MKATMHTADAQLSDLRAGSKVIDCDGNTVEIAAIRQLTPEVCQIRQTDGAEYEIEGDCYVTRA